MMACPRLRRPRGVLAGPATRVAGARSPQAGERGGVGPPLGGQSTVRPCVSEGAAVAGLGRGPEGVNGARLGGKELEVTERSPGSG
ncbi:hypothetical protein AAFF_G00391930 [Aldrovandia affinis]|uniref:Uncharacterized protein n=1 Tax=Aldrovandia affinis TaxID=143900 RepID=A0AAD7SE14_9TELE|nr:hypothetical protein AAFF_G00391930 [Aldrovandia affinis]